MNLKQLFCKHIWRDEKEEFLRTEKEQTWSYLLVAYFYSVKKYYAVTKKCVKCDKTVVIEEFVTGVEI